MLQQVGQPRRILDIRLPPRHRLAVAGIGHKHLELGFNRLKTGFRYTPVLSMATIGIPNACSQSANARTSPGVVPNSPHLRAGGRQRTRRQRLLMHIQTAAPFIQNLHGGTSFAMVGRGRPHMDSTWYACSLIAEWRQLGILDGSPGQIPVRAHRASDHRTLPPTAAPIFISWGAGGKPA